MSACQPVSRRPLPRAFSRDPPGVARPTCPGAPSEEPATRRHRPRRRQRGTGQSSGSGTYREGSAAVGGGRVPHVCARACPRPRVPARAPGRARRAGLTDSRAPTDSAHGVGAGSGRLPLPPIAAQGGRPDAQLAIPECAPGAGRGRVSKGAWGCARARGQVRVGARRRACPGARPRARERGRAAGAGSSFDGARSWRLRGEGGGAESGTT